MVGTFIEVAEQIQHVTPNQFEQMIKEPVHPLVKQLFGLEQEIRTVREHIQVEPGKESMHILSSTSIPSIEELPSVVKEKEMEKEKDKSETKETLKKEKKEKIEKQDKKKETLPEKTKEPSKKESKEESIDKEDKKEDKKEKDKPKLVVEDYKMITSEQLESLTVDELRELCTEKGVKRGGTKPEVKERLNELNLRMNDVNETIMDKLRNSRMKEDKKEVKEEKKEVKEIKEEKKDQEKKEVKEDKIVIQTVKVSEEDNKPLYMRKQNIPKHVKTLVWNKYCGIESVTAKCISCRSETIDCRSFHCGHVLSEAKGGDVTITNLRPVCAKCNLSMGTRSMEEFTMQFFGWDIPK